MRARVSAFVYFFLCASVELRGRAINEVLQPFFKRTPNEETVCGPPPPRQCVKTCATHVAIVRARGECAVSPSEAHLSSPPMNLQGRRLRVCSTEDMLRQACIVKDHRNVSRKVCKREKRTRPPNSSDASPGGLSLNLVGVHASLEFGVFVVKSRDFSEVA